MFKGHKSRGFVDQSMRQRKMKDYDLSNGCSDATRLAEEPIYVETDLDTVSCLLLDPVADVVACAGRGGPVRMMNCSTKECSSAFHVTGSAKG